MRNILFFAIAAICMSSCTKVYECKCEDSRTVNKKDELYSISASSKNDADNRCQEYQQKLFVNGFKYSCSID